jgi:hypothetical protein
MCPVAGARAALLSTVLVEVRRQLPFSLRGIDTDNDSVFINETLRAYAEQANIVFTRCRPSRRSRRSSNRRREPWSDEWSVIGVSRGLGRLRCSLSTPVCELLSAVVLTDRKTARRRTRPQILQRVGDAASAVPPMQFGPDCRKSAPVALLRDIRSAQQRLADLADVKSADDSTAAAPPIDLFLASLRTAWKEGSSRPTDRPILKAKRGRRRPDPLVQATPQLLDWFRAEPWRTGAELLTKLQAEHPGAYPDKLLNAPTPSQILA